ncbi:MAG: hypothetical protein WDN23_07370 [Edaphobacter sp.]
MPGVFSNLFNKTLLAVSTFLIVILFTLSTADWPALYRFAAGQNPPGHWAALHVPLRLDDDVMISLRAGYMIEETGKPSFNRSDLAQPSTSYAAPYLFSWLLHCVDKGLAIYLYALLGLACVALTMCCLVQYSKSRVLGVILAAALCLTTTHLLYSLKGWDHLFQGLFLTAATCLSLRKADRPQTPLVISLLLALGTLFRPDGVLLALGILASLWFSTHRWKVLLSGLIPYLILMAAALAINYHQFGHLTPTTARLKLGGGPPLGYILHYILANGILSYSALTLFVVLLILSFGSRIITSNRQAIPIVFACVITVGFSLYNSDYFAGARMVWSSTCILAATFACLESPLSFPKFEAAQLGKAASSWRSHPTMRLILVLYAALVATGVMITAIRQRMQEATISSRRLETSAVAQQYVIAHWINANLHPQDGALGFFYLGVSYDLPSFEIADFLGKADEAIATLKAKQGAPGHNKWDLDRTLAKWKPQAIVPPGPIDPNLPETRENSYRHTPNLLLNSTIVDGFQYCYVPAREFGVVDKWGFFLRDDIAAQHTNELRCSHADSP